MKWFKPYLVSLVVLIIVLIALLAYSYLPLVQTQKTIPFSLLTLADLQSDLPTDLPEFLNNEQRTLSLSYPAQLWAGQEGTITMLISPVNPDTQLSDDNSNSNPSGYNVDVEVRLELDNVEVVPGKTIIEPIKEGKPVLFLYKINSDSALQIRGNLWVYLNLVQTQSGKDWQVARLALPLESEIDPFLGMTVSLVRIIGYSLLALAFTGILLLVLSQQSQKKKRSR